MVNAGMVTSVRSAIQRRRLLSVDAKDLHAREGSHLEVLRPVHRQRRVMLSRTLVYVLTTIVLSLMTLMLRQQLRQLRRQKPKPRLRPSPSRKERPRLCPLPQLYVCLKHEFPLAPAIRKRINPCDDEVSDCSSVDGGADSDCSTGDRRGGGHHSPEERCRKQGYGFVWPPGSGPFMINSDGKRISLFVNSDIPYVRAGSQKSVAHDDEFAADIKAMFDQMGEGRWNLHHPWTLLLRKEYQEKKKEKKHYLMKWSRNLALWMFPTMNMHVGLNRGPLPGGRVRSGFRVKHMISRTRNRCVPYPIQNIRI